MRIVRALGVTTAVMLAVSGVTFAALQSQDAVLQGNTITSATANLLIGDGSGTFGAATNGYNFTNIEPGPQLQPAGGNMITLRNNGSTKLGLRLSMRPTNFSNPSNVNIDRIYVAITPAGGTMQEHSLADLLTAYSGGAPISLGTTVNAGQDIQVKFQVQIASDVITSTTSAVNLSGIDLVFSGLSTAS